MKVYEGEDKLDESKPLEWMDTKIKLKDVDISNNG